jgi:glutamate/tyrosine decarboxylase-like PLP-dependent enzyme
VSNLDDLMRAAAEHVAAYRAKVGEREVFPRHLDLEGLRQALGPVPDEGTAPGAVIDEMVRLMEPAVIATVGPRYFGFVVGGALDAATAAEVVAAGWDQPAFNAVTSPAAAVVEDVVGGWLKELLGLPPTASFGFVTGGQGANTVALAAARQHVLAVAGWDVGRRGLLGAPAVRVVVNRERHATIDRALRLLGLGTDVIEEVATDEQGAIDVADLERVLASGDGPAIVCLQAGNVNTGAVDDLAAACAAARPTRPGSTSTAPSACGPPPVPPPATWWRGSKGPTRGPPTATSG